jgi:hypothetical protein
MAARLWAAAAIWCSAAGVAAAQVDFPIPVHFVLNLVHKYSQLARA